jgi:hypothetical protein
MRVVEETLTPQAVLKTEAENNIASQPQVSKPLVSDAAL